MKRFAKLCLGMLLVVASAIGTSVGAYAAPDLRFASMGIISRTARTATLRYWVTNYGNTSAPIFKVSAEARRSGTPFYAVAQTAVPGSSSRSDGWYMWTPWALPASGAVRFDATITFPSSWVGSVDFRLRADSCSGDEFMPSYCRANESNELNNISRLFTVTLN